jgi:hypothetical protein
MRVPLSPAMRPIVPNVASRTIPVRVIAFRKSGASPSCSFLVESRPPRTLDITEVLCTKLNGTTACERGRVKATYRCGLSCRRRTPSLGFSGFCSRAPCAPRVIVANTHCLSRRRRMAVAVRVLVICDVPTCDRGGRRSVLTA